MLELAGEWGYTDINRGSAQGWTALHSAAMYGNYDVIKTLLDLGANINAAYKDGGTPFHYALRYNSWRHEEGKLRLARLLVDAGSDPNRVDEYGCAPLQYALGYFRDDDRSLPFAQLLIDSGADVNLPSRGGTSAHSYYLEGSFNHIMLHYDKPRLLETLIRAGVNVNALDSHGRSALMLHSFLGDSADIVKMLIAAGADVNHKNPHGETALMYALRRGRTENAEALIAAGADVNVQAINGDTPLMYCANIYWDEDKIDCTQLLIGAGADINIQNEDGETILMRLINIHYSYDYWKELYIKRIKVLLENALKGDANDRRGINLKDRHGCTALMYAAADPDFPDDVLKLMIDAGARGESLNVIVPERGRARSELLGMEDIWEGDR